MKTTSTTSLALAALLLVACAHRGGGEGGVQGTTAQAAVAEPGAQPDQAALMQQQQAQGGPAQAWAQPGASAAQALGPVMLQEGQKIAAQGAPNGVTACASCHGAQGEGTPAGGFPRIAGQSAYYLGKQLAAYANGARINPIMQPIAKAMSAEQIRDVSGYFATLGGAAGAAPAAGKPASARGQQLARDGDESKHVQACGNCHGPGGAGEPPIFPYLAGQHASYLSASMQAWKSGARKTDMSGQMVEIARALSDADVAALSAYFSAQPAPAPAATMVNVATGSPTKPAVAAAANAPGPRAAGGAGVTGAGSEAGAPVMGGSQGGGGGTQGTKPPEPPVKH
jgi:cytochrome c553